jgi:tRNA(Ile)-lysidine synthase
MLKDFQSHINLNFPTLLESPFLIACSGGLDSVVLTQLCYDSGLNFAIAHCNFELRGIDSDTDEIFVKEYSAQLGKEFFSIHFDTISYVNEKKITVQMAARELRYTWFHDVLEKHNLTHVLTAHHLDDALETFLINLSRGSGIDGLTGIPEKTNTIARPLLKYSRAELLAYAKLNKLSWREDVSNTDTKYLRNKIRAQVVPLLKELHPNFLDNFKHSTQYLNQSATIAKNQIAAIQKELFVEENGLLKIDVNSLKQLDPLEGYLYGLFQAYGFTEWENLKDLLDAMSGKYLLSATHKLLKDRTALLLSSLEMEEDTLDAYAISINTTTVRNPITLDFVEVDYRNENVPTIIYVDKLALKYPLVVRKWKKGDYFYPIGFSGKKKLAKYFKDEKVPVVLKEKQWLLCSGDDIIWIIGRRADERFKVRTTTKEILKIEVTL